MVRYNPDGSVTIGRECDLIEQPERKETVGTASSVPSDQTEPAKTPTAKKRGRPKK